ncbi:MAG: hypothetical protein ACQESG_02565 [Nanobdellota archaeon]
MGNKIIYVSLLLILIIIAGCTTKTDQNTEKPDGSREENILSKQCDQVGEKRNNCECLKIAQGVGSMWVCNNEIKCGDEVKSIELFKKNNCECLVAEMPGCGFDSSTGLIQCGALECK